VNRAVFDLERFIADCRAALSEEAGPRAVREIVARAVSDSAAVIKALGEPTRAGMAPLYRSSDLTIVDFHWGPSMTMMPHDHRIWGVIGVYTGREDNIFWRRITTGDGSTCVEAAGARAISAGDVEPLGRDIVHSVTNPLPRITGALQVYGGDFFATARSEWDAETLRERPFDLEKARRLFEETNVRWRLA
jgi:predicted metal-dependent enzyme (double-stranded beta helix superfamily)